MKEEQKKEIKRNTVGRDITDYMLAYDEQAYNYWRTASSCQVQPMISKVASEKVTNMVGTFFYDDSDSFHVPVTQAASEKVTDMVGTFLNEDSNSNHDFRNTRRNFIVEKLRILIRFQ